MKFRVGDRVEVTKAGDGWWKPGDRGTVRQTGEHFVGVEHDNYALNENGDEDPGLGHALMGLSVSGQKGWNYNGGGGGRLKLVEDKEEAPKKANDESPDINIHEVI